MSKASTMRRQEKIGLAGRTVEEAITGYGRLCLIRRDNSIKADRLHLRRTRVMQALSKQTPDAGRGEALAQVACWGLLSR
jgi:hypothetical protein